jgi:hypothetical protein
MKVPKLQIGRLVKDYARCEHYLYEEESRIIHNRPDSQRVIRSTTIAAFIGVSTTSRRADCEQPDLLGVKQGEPY